MADKLTRQQYTAVKNRGGKLLVSAAAGSGKTKVLVDRLLDYILDPVQPANIDDFLIITYTKAAAAELRGKIAAKLSEKIGEHPENKHLKRQMQRLYLAKISTVHAFCADILREYSFQLGIPVNFRVADEAECLELRTQAMQTVLESAYGSEEMNSDFIVFLDMQGVGRNDALIPQIVEKVFDSARCHLNPQQWLDACLDASTFQDLTDASQSVWGQYLMDDLFSYLDEQIKALNHCVEAVSKLPGLEKQAALLSDTVFQLNTLRKCQTWDEIVERKNIDYGRLVFPKKADVPSVTEPVKTVRNTCKEGLERKLKPFAEYSNQILSDQMEASAAAQGLLWLVGQFSDEYDRLKRIRKVLDFGDLEHRTLDLLYGKGRRTPTAAAKNISTRFREIMVDEYQDSNAVQDAIFSSLTERQNLFMVGDVKQSIYQFRLADPGIFLNKYGKYVPAETAMPGQGRKVVLSHNFRSGNGVLQAVNDVFGVCMSPKVGGLEYGEAEALREGIEHIQLVEPEVELHCIDVQSDTYLEEAAFAADTIVSLLDGNHMVRDGERLRPIVPDDIVILLRSPGSVGADFQNALEARGLRVTSGGGVDLLQTDEVSTLIAILQIISNPRQDIPLLSALMSPVFGFTADELADIRGQHRSGELYEALLCKKTEKSERFVILLQALRTYEKLHPLSELVKELFRLTQIDLIYGSLPDGAMRNENLISFFQYVSDFAEGGNGGLSEFLRHLQSVSEKGVVVSSERSAGGCITIMSIHKSKGLEFPVVLLCGLSRRFNRDSAQAQVLCDKELGLGLSIVDRENRVRYPSLSKRAIAVKQVSDGLSEELRVLYVAMTRARDRLIMTYASDSLDTDIRDMVMRKQFMDHAAMASQVSNPGQWVLLCALEKTEAGELFAFCGESSQTSPSDFPWKITVQQAIVVDHNAEVPNEEKEEQEKQYVSSEEIQDLSKLLAFRYSYIPATEMPSKQTATQMKGRELDREAAEQTARNYILAERNSWRRPTFVQKQSGGREYGNAMHAVMQYIRFEACTDTDSVHEEVKRLIHDNYITESQGELVRAERIAAFFRTELGQKVSASKHVVREFKFSILDDASKRNTALINEQVLLQGVVDCAVIEEDGIIIIDFKTDYVTDETVEQVADSYRQQVNVYADALSRIYSLPIKQTALYFFALNRFVFMQ